MAYELKTAEEDLLAAGTNLGKHIFARVYNTTSADVVITRADSEGTTIGTITLGGGNTIDLIKEPEDLLSAPANAGEVKATPYSRS